MHPPDQRAGGSRPLRFVVLLFTLISIVKGNQDVQLMKRRIPRLIYLRALAVTVISAGLVIFATFVLTLTEHRFHQQKIHYPEEKVLIG